MTRRTLFIAYYFAIFLQAGTYGLTFLLPPLFATFGGTETNVGFVLGITAVTTIITILWLGHVTARFGRMQTIAVSSALITIALFIFGAADSLSVTIYVAGGLLGIGWGLYYVLTPVVLTQLIADTERVRAFTLLSVFVMAGFGLSPVLGGSLVKLGYGIEFAFILLALLCLVSGAIFWMLKGPVAAHSIASSQQENSELSISITLQVLRTKALRPIIMVWLGASVFAAVANFQTVYAGLRGLDYSWYFLAYTITVVICRIVLAEFIGGRAPYGIIAALLAVMTASILLLLMLGDNNALYVLAAVLFGIGYGVSYPIVKAMGANDAKPEIMSQTLQIFGVAYFIGVFGFPFVAGWIINNFGMIPLLYVAAIMATFECLAALQRYKNDGRQ